MDEIPELLKNIIGSVIRNAGTPLVAWLAARGWVGQDDGNAVLAVLVTVFATLAWGIYQKYKGAVLIKAALKLPAGATLEEAKAFAANSRR